MRISFANNFNNGFRQTVFVYDAIKIALHLIKFKDSEHTYSQTLTL